MADLLGELDTNPDMQAQFENMLKELGAQREPLMLQSVVLRLNRSETKAGIRGHGGGERGRVLPRNDQENHGANASLGCKRNSRYSFRRRQPRRPVKPR